MVPSRASMMPTMRSPNWTFSLADDGVGDVAQLLDGLQRHAVSVLQGLQQVGALGVDGHAVVGDNNVNALARGGDGGHVGADGGDAALQQRSDDDGALCTLCGIGMAALCAGDDAIGAETTLQLKWVSTSREARMT